MNIRIAYKHWRRAVDFLCAPQKQRYDIAVTANKDSVTLRRYLFVRAGMMELAATIPCEADGPRETHLDMTTVAKVRAPADSTVVIGESQIEIGGIPYPCSPTGVPCAEFAGGQMLCEVPPSRLIECAHIIRAAHILKMYDIEDVWLLSTEKRAVAAYASDCKQLARYTLLSESDARVNVVAPMEIWSAVMAAKDVSSAYIEANKSALRIRWLGRDVELIAMAYTPPEHKEVCNAEQFPKVLAKRGQEDCLVFNTSDVLPVCDAIVQVARSQFSNREDRALVSIDFKTHNGKLVCAGNNTKTPLTADIRKQYDAPDAPSGIQVRLSALRLQTILKALADYPRICMFVAKDRRRVDIQPVGCDYIAFALAAIVDTAEG